MHIPNRPIEIVTINQIHQIFAPVVEPLLIPMGFQLQKPLHWVRSDNAPIRQLFCFRQWKGGDIAPTWGLSLDFVPHVSGSTVKWHRTVKSARLDLTYDARDRELDILFVYGPRPLIENAPRVIKLSVDRANPLWRNTLTITDLPKAFEDVKRYLSTGGLGFYNYTQHPIVYAFVLAKNGQRDAGLAELKESFDYRDESVREKLLSLFTAACAKSLAGSSY